jgi:ribulose kinase
VDDQLQPLDDYYLWCDHRAWREAAEITARAQECGLANLDWCGGSYSSEWGFAKTLHWLRSNAAQRRRFHTALEHCDHITATLCGITDPSQVPRSICAMGHKWMWNEALGGLPGEEFLSSVDPLLAGLRDRLDGRYATSRQIAGGLSPQWAQRLGLRAGIPIPTGGLDAHWDAVGAGCRVGDRCVLGNPQFRGVTIGWRLHHTAADELFAAIEGTAFHTRIILERLREFGIPTDRLIHAGGIPSRNPSLNRVYANVFGKPVLLPRSDVTTLGSAIFAFLAAGTFGSLQEAQMAMSPGYDVVEPHAEDVAAYEPLYARFRALYFTLSETGDAPPTDAELLKALASSKRFRGAGFIF